MLTFNKYGKDHPITFELASYAENGNLYVGMFTVEDGYDTPWSSLTVNLSVKCKPNRAFIDTNNNGTGIIYWLEDNKLGRYTGNLMPSGFCMYPEFEFDMDALMQHVTKDYREV